jgi:hypothetical protein
VCKSIERRGIWDEQEAVAVVIVQAAVTAWDIPAADIMSVAAEALEVEVVREAEALEGAPEAEALAEEIEAEAPEEALVVLEGHPGEALVDPEWHPAEALVDQEGRSEEASVAPECHHPDGAEVQAADV